ncbi:unnamed protein product [Adineta steineri]|uniref:Glycosyltransferase family 32 protein n=1 Tax=Adineta steineri TaxID=433720 RepID=A0A814CQB8_9BILA|nr:unnamed protein product [Adineta steineri]CAF1203282.1 unnamed protein product [Adineta steineri]
MQSSRTSMFSKHMRYRYIYRYTCVLFIVFSSLWIIFHCNNNCQRILSNDESFGTYEIPNIVHFITGQGDASESILDQFGPHLGYRRLERASGEFHLINYLVLLSARQQIKPKQIYLHYSFEPTGYWWLKAKQDRQLNLTLVKIPPITSIYNHPLHHHAHRSDIARLETLDKYGGIYLDLDVLVLKSFSKLISNSYQVEAIFAWEDKQYNTICNAVIIAPIHSKFLRRIYQSYQSFNSSCWACHSVFLTGQLANIYQNEVYVLPSKAFFTPSWSHIGELYLYNKYNFKNNYACHLWNSYIGKEFLHNLTITSILKPTRMTTFIRMIHHAVGKEKLNTIAREFS